MPAIERAMTTSDLRAERLLANLGRELRVARTARGLSQAVVAAATGVEQTEVSRIERGRRPGATVRSLSRLSVALGLELSVRVFPVGEPVRDKAHVALLQRFQGAIGAGWKWEAEVPLPIPGDRRAWDRVLRRAGVTVAVEAETRPTDLQELQRRLALKKRDGQVERLVLVLANTEWCRRLLRLNELEATFPVPADVALRALAHGRDPGGDAVILV
jgi:transcriptional regulator with XRE-family HTH domain